MIMIWNKKEVFVGYSSEKFNKVLDILNANKIKYAYKLVNNSNVHLLGSTRGRTGTLAENMDYSTMHYVYVHKRDYDAACKLCGVGKVY